jgi:hypothetical protein
MHFLPIYLRKTRDISGHRKCSHRKTSRTFDLSLGTEWLRLNAMYCIVPKRVKRLLPVKTKERPPRRSKRSTDLAGAQATEVPCVGQAARVGQSALRWTRAIYRCPCDGAQATEVPCVGQAARVGQSALRCTRAIYRCPCDGAGPSDASRLNGCGAVWVRLASNTGTRCRVALQEEWGTTTNRTTRLRHYDTTGYETTGSSAELYRAMAGGARTAVPPATRRTPQRPTTPAGDKTIGAGSSTGLTDGHWAMAMRAMCLRSNGHWLVAMRAMWAMRAVWL